VTKPAIEPQVGEYYECIHDGRVARVEAILGGGTEIVIRNADTFRLTVTSLERLRFRWSKRSLLKPEGA
jgi:hypothetical protein